MRELNPSPLNTLVLSRYRISAKYLLVPTFKHATLKHVTLKHGHLNTGQINTRMYIITRQLNTKTL